MGDALTIVVVHFSRQQSQSLLNVGQVLKAGADFLQHENAPGPSSDVSPVRHASVNAAHFAPHPAQSVEGRRAIRQTAC